MMAIFNPPFSIFDRQFQWSISARLASGSFWAACKRFFQQPASA